MRRFYKKWSNIGFDEKMARITSKESLLSETLDVTIRSNSLNIIFSITKSLLNYMYHVTVNVQNLTCKTFRTRSLSPGDDGCDIFDQCACHNKMSEPQTTPTGANEMQTTQECTQIRELGWSARALNGHVSVTVPFILVYQTIFGDSFQT